MKVSGWEEDQRLSKKIEKAQQEANFLRACRESNRLQLIERLESELTEWRSGKRRVFWRIRKANGDFFMNCCSKPVARYHKPFGHKIYRVTVRPKLEETKSRLK